MLKKTNLTNFQKFLELFTQKVVTKLSKIWVRDPGIPDPGSRGQKTTGSRIRIRNTEKNRLSTFILPVVARGFWCSDP
jgi:hypothetical protein